MTTLRAEKTYEKYAWVIFFALGILSLIPVFFNLTETVDHTPAGYVIPTVPTGLSILGLSALTILVSWTGYRRGERWAWYVFLYLPYSLAVDAYDQSVRGYPWQGLVVLILLSFLGLLLPYRKFFPKMSGTGGS